MNIEEIKRKLQKDLETLRTREGYLNAGYPRYNTLFGRDSLISAWQMLRIDPSIAQATLEILAKYQGKAINPTSEEEPGKILHEHRFDLKEQAELPEWDFPYYGSVDSTPLFIFLFAEYFKQTNDGAFLRKKWTNIMAAFKWIMNYGDSDRDGYLEYERMNPHGLFHQGWRDSQEDHLKIETPVALVEAQGYAYAAFRSIIWLAKAFKSDNIAKIALQKAQALRKKFNKEFWIDDEEYYALALDGEKNQKKAVTSNPGHLFFTEIVCENRMRPIISRFFQPDLWTSYGIRNHSSEEPDFDPTSYHLGSIWPHDNWIAYKGLKIQGFEFHADRIKRALLRAYDRLGKIPEFYTVVREEIVDLSENSIGNAVSNPLQAWASAGLLEMIWDN